MMFEYIFFICSNNWIWIKISLLLISISAINHNIVQIHFCKKLKLLSLWIGTILEIYQSGGTTQILISIKSPLIHVFKYIFSVFKQYYTYFHTYFHLYIFSKKYKQYYYNKITKRFLGLVWYVCLNNNF